MNSRSTETMTIEEKRRLNSRAPISRLPPEILSLVFSNIRDDHLAVLTEGFNLPHDAVGSELWNVFTHVCHGWREISLGTPTLWTRMVSSPNNHKWTQELLLRSKRCPFMCIVEGSLDSCDSANGRTELMKQLGRAHTVSMRGVPCRDLHKYWVSKVDAAQLDFLAIQVDDEDTSSEIPFILSDSNLHAPSLQSLQIENCGVDWKSGFLSSKLTHLGLDGLPAESLLECRELIKILANMPLLEDVCLSYEYIQVEDGGVPPLDDTRTRLHWPHMQHLDITDDVINIARFLNYISLPLHSKLHLKTCDLMHEARPYLPSVLHWLSNHFKQLPTDDTASQVVSKSCIRSLVIGELDDEFRIQGFDEVLQLEQEGQEIYALLVLSFIDFENENLHLFGGTLVDMILPRLPIHSIVFLDVAIGSFYLSVSCWLNIFGSIPTLEYIRLCASRPMPFFHALRPFLSTSGRPPFVALKSISLVAHLFPIDFLAVVRILGERTEFGLRLREFVFPDVHDSLPPYQAVSQLMEVVDKVGIYYGPCDDSDKE